MFLKKVKQKNGRVHLSIAKNYRQGGKTKTDTIKSLGYLDELVEEYADPIGHFQAVAKEMTDQEAKQYASIQITVHPMEKIDKRVEGQRKNIGCAVLLYHYNSLMVERALRNAARRKKFDYDPNAAMRLYVVERIFNPGSKLAALTNSPQYFFKTKLTEDDIYRTLDFLAECKAAVVAAMDRAIKAVGKRDTESVFYDVTNYYFEIDTPDADGPQGPGLRKKGVNKKKSKSDKPIIQMGLLQDKNAIPITYKTFSGNTNDCTTLLPVLKELKAHHALKDVVVVADKGINTSDSIAACLLDGNGFVFSQSIRGKESPAALKQWVLTDVGYQTSADGAFKSKSRQDTKTVTVRDSLGSVIGKVDVDIKVVAFWSKKYATRANAKRLEVLAKAYELIASPSAYNRATHFGAARYVDNITFDKKSGAVIEDTNCKAVLNEAAVAEDKECDGYYLIITSETDWPDDKIIDTYQGLWRIEEAFKITKSDIAARPVFVWTPEHIEAHFLTCFIALTILRLIQYDTGFKYSATSIIEELKAMSGTNEDSNMWLFDHRSDLSDELCASVGIDLSKRRMKLEDIKAVLARVNEKS